MNRSSRHGSSVSPLPRGIASSKPRYSSSASSRPVTNRVNSDVSPKLYLAESHGIRAAPLSSSSSPPDPNSSIGTLRYVLPSTGTRTATELPRPELPPSDENVPSESPTVVTAATDALLELDDADELALALDDAVAPEVVIALAVNVK